MRSQFLMAVVCGASFAFGCSRPVSPPDESSKDKTGQSSKEAKDGQPAAKTPPGKEILAVSEAERKAILYFEKLSGKANISTLNSDRRVMKLDLNSTSAEDADLKMLESLTALEELDLGKTKITDAGLVHLKGLKNLRTLNLAFDDVTDDGLPHLKGLTKLGGLYLTFTKVTNKGKVDLQMALPDVSISR